MFYRSILVLFTAALASKALSVPQEGPLKVETEECDLRLWVRADDLSPSTIVEGDARLLNNISGLSTNAASGCKVLEWSLHLRYRERAAIQIPISTIHLPDKPSYNYTWDKESRVNQDYKVGRMLSNGEDMSSLFETVVDPYEKEVKQYQRQLEEYVKAVSSADKWIIRDEEIVFFEAIQNVSRHMDVREGLQQATFPFGIAVPSVRFPESHSRPSYIDSRKDIAESVMATDEMDMNYFAKIHLANGSIVQVNGGRTKFFTPGRDANMNFKTTNLTLVQQKKDCGMRVFSAVDGSEKLDSSHQETNNTRHRDELSATVEAPSHIIRGKNFTIKGRISSSEYIPTRIWVDIHTHREKKWAQDQIAKAGSSTSRNKTDLEQNSGSGFAWSSSKQWHQHSSALFLKNELQNYIDEVDHGIVRDPYERMSPFRAATQKKHAIKSIDGSFAMEYTPGSDNFGFGSTYFAEHKAEFVVKVEAKRILKQDIKSDQGDKVLKESKNVHQKAHDDFLDWSESDRRSCSLTKCQATSSEDVVTFEGRIPIDGFSNEAIALEKRGNLLSSLLKHEAAKCPSKSIPLDYLKDGALAPFFVDLTNEAEIKAAASLVNPCSPPSRQFQPINTTPTSLQHIPVSLTNHSFPESTIQMKGEVKYRKTKYSRNGIRFGADCWKVPGSCGGANQDVGTVWVKKVLLRKLKSERVKDAERKEDRVQDDVPPFVLQV